MIPVFILYDRRLENPLIDFEALKDRVLRNAILSAFFTSVGYFSVVFLVIMYLQGIRALTPLNASLLLVPGYVAGSFLGPIMGRLSDKYGSREIATLGIFFLALAILIYLTIERHFTALHCAYLLQPCQASEPPCFSQPTTAPSWQMQEQDHTAASLACCGPFKILD